MATVSDVAAYVLSRGAPMTAMKLQKLVYYSQAWSIVWDEEPLFPERIEAWANGPVCPALYNQHRGAFKLEAGHFGVVDAQALTKTQVETIDLVLGFYGEKNAQWLSDLTHMEAPWNLARERAHAAPGAMCNEEITLEDMSEYYSSLPPGV
jgi:uncharacterized phage-associated protein